MGRNSNIDDGIDDKYLNDVAGLDDNSGDHDHDTDTTTDDSSGTTDNTSATPVGTRDTQATTDDHTGPVPKTDTKAPQAKDAKVQQPTTAQSELTPLQGGVYADKQGNIVSADGKLIAEKGFAARMHQQNQRFRQQNETLTQEVNQLRERNTELRALDTSMRTAGINADEMAQALDFASRYKRGDVLGIAKEIVALAMASGHNATDILGKDVGDSIDMRGVKAMLDERLGPVAKARQDEAANEERTRVARENYNRFITDNEYAEVHGDAIVRMARAENINMQTAYNRLFQFAVTNGLDFALPLGPQIEERNNAVRQQPATQQPTPKPMPNGASTRANGALPTAQEPMNDADDDWGTIIRQAMTTM